MTLEVISSLSAQEVEAKEKKRIFTNPEHKAYLQSVLYKVDKEDAYLVLAAHADGKLKGSHGRDIVDALHFVTHCKTIYFVYRDNNEQKDRVVRWTHEVGFVEVAANKIDLRKKANGIEHTKTVSLTENANHLLYHHAEDWKSKPAPQHNAPYAGSMR